MHRHNKAQKIQAGVNTVGAALCIIIPALLNNHQPTTEHKVSPDDVQVLFSNSEVTAQFPTPGSLTGQNTMTMSIRCEDKTLVLSSPQRMAETTISPGQYPILEYLYPGITLVNVCPDRLNPASVPDIQQLIATSALATYVTSP